MQTKEGRRTTAAPSVAVLLALALVGAATAVTCAEKTQIGKRPDRPVILRPENEANVPDPERPNCPEDEPCPMARVEGAVPEGLWPFLVVAPLNAAPNMWVQPPITMVQEDGTFDGVVHCGNYHEGMGGYFKIFIIAHRDRKRFKRGLVLTKIPDECGAASQECMVSDSVTVYRTR